MSKLLEDSLKEMRKADGANRAGVCSWGGIGPSDGKIHRYNAICLGALNYDGQKYKSLWHLHRPSCDKRIATAFLRAILNKQSSPWKDLIKGQEPQKFKDIYNSGYVLTNLEFPANYVVNFLTAFRITQEYGEMSKLWYRLHKDGVKLGTAICTIGLVSHYDEKTNTVSIGSVDRGHWPMSWLQGDAEYVNRVNSGKPLKEYLSGHLFSARTYYTPCNVIWGKGVGWNFSNVVEELNKFLKNHKGKESKSRFPNPNELPQFRYKYEGLLAWCRRIDKGK